MSDAATHTNRVTVNVPPRARPLTVYVKPSDYCNVGCDHCYLPESVRANKSRMTQKTFDATLEAVRKMAVQQNAPGVLIVWHGGEPLSLPVDYFMNLAAQTHQELPGAIQSLQTSLIPYNQRWETLIATYFEGEIGSSIDFTQRTLKGSAKSYQDFWMKKVNMARAAGFNVIPGVVPSKHEIGKGAELCQWMKENGFTSWNIDRYNQFKGFDPLRPLNVEHSHFLREVFDETMKQAKLGHFTAINVVKAGIAGILYNQPGERWGGHCSHDFLVVNPDGSTNSCPDKISFESFSNINEGYETFKKSKGRKNWIKLHLLEHRNPDCPTCPFNTFCKSGCPLTPNDVPIEGECSGYNRYLHHIQNFAKANKNLLVDYLEATQ